MNPSFAIYKKGSTCDYVISDNKIESVSKNIYKILNNDIVNIEDYKVIHTSKEYIFGILELNSRTIYHNNKKRFFPIDKRYPVFYVGTNKPFSNTNIYASINFLKWENNDAIGMIHNYYGDVGDYNIEKNIYKIQASLNWMNNKKIDISNYLVDLTPDRINLTNLNTYSIDPVGCKDIDDAISYMKDEYHHIYIHIADVTSFIKENSLLDNELKNRCESIYGVDYQVNMIPDELSIQHISLIKNKVSRAFTTEIIVDKEYKILETKFYKSNINVINLDYDTAQENINSGKNNDLNELYKITKELASYINYEISEYDTHILVEILMILTNHLVAEKLLEKDNKNILVRTHKGLKKEELTNYLNTKDNKIKNIIKNMNTYRAIYDISQEQNIHTGLGINNYVHFTSPIRRYADIISHRQLWNVINNKEKDKLDNIVIYNLNEKHKLYSDLENERIILDKINDIDPINIFESYVISITNNFITVFIEKLKIIHRIKLVHNELLDLIDIEYDENIYEIKFNNNIIKLGDKINIKTIKVNKQYNKIISSIEFTQ